MSKKRKHEPAPVKKPLSKEEKLMEKLRSTPKDGEPNAFQKVAAEVRADVAGHPQARPPDPPMPSTLHSGQWFVHHGMKRCVGEVTRVLEKERALIITNYLGVSMTFKYSFLLKCGYEPSETIDKETYTNTFDIKRSWKDPVVPEKTPMSEETKAKLRAINESKRKSKLPGSGPDGLTDEDGIDGPFNKEMSKPIAKKPGVNKTEKTMKPCLCGCGGQTKSFFAPGHDVKFKKQVFGKLPLTAAQMDYALNAKWVSDELKAELRKRP